MTQQRPTLPALLPNREAYQERLQKILPRDITGTSATDNPAAGACAFVMMYVGAVDGQNPVRPMMVTHMRDAIAARHDEEFRQGYYVASGRSGKAIDKLCAEWNIPQSERWYASDSREGPRDETFKNWADNNALVVDAKVKTTASSGRYTLAPRFAALFDPALDGENLDQAISAWQRKNLSTIARARAKHRAGQAKAAHEILVKLPVGGTRALLPGPSSEIIKGLIENSHRLLKEPSVIFISQSGEPVNVVDSNLLKSIGFNLQKLSLLPDALLVDVREEHGTFWFIEAVASDGPVDEARKKSLTEWAESCGVPAESCRFLTAFVSRTKTEAKKCLPRLARGSYAWFLDEPDALLSWQDLTTG